MVFKSPFPAAETEARIRDARGGGNLIIAEDNDSLGKKTREEEGEGLCEKGRILQWLGDVCKGPGDWQLLL